MLIIIASVIYFLYPVIVIYELLVRKKTDVIDLLFVIATFIITFIVFKNSDYIVAGAVGPLSITTKFFLNKLKGK